MFKAPYYYRQRLDRILLRWSKPTTNYEKLILKGYSPNSRERKGFQTAFSRSAVLSAEAGLCYMNNPKVACSTIKASLWLSHADGAASFNGDPGDFRNSPLIRDYRDVVRAIRQNETSFISCVRNPFSRLESAWKDKLLAGREPELKALILRDLNISEVEAGDFDKFCRSLAAAKIPNPHVRPQYLNIWDDVIDFRFIGTFEYMHEFFDAISEITHFEPYSWAPHSTKDIIGVDLSLSDEAVDNILTVYAQDFERFGYSKDPTDRSPKEKLIRI